MPEPAYMRIRHRKEIIPGPITKCGEDNLWEIHEFAHEISGKQPEDPWSLSPWGAKHKVLQVVLEVGAFLPRLYRVKVDRDEYINRVEIFWLQYSEEQKKKQFYFKHTIYPVKITSITMLMPNVKDPQYEQYNHLVAIEFRYRFIEHLYTEGYLNTKAEWHHFFTDESDEPIPERYLTGRCLSHEALEWEENWRKEQEQNKSLTITIERFYHDNEPVQEAPFEIELADATTVKGTLDTTGNASVTGLKSTPKRIRFEPDAREFKPVNLVENAEYKASFSQADADTIVTNATAKTEQPPEKKGIVLDSIQWVTGTLQGSFNQKQTTSQIIVDAIIGMIPVVGDVTAVRDIIMVTIGLSLEEAKRKDKLQWLTLVLLLFALIPVIGGAIKGVGRLLLNAGKQALQISDFVAVLNRIGAGDAVKFIKDINLTKYTADLRGRWRWLLQRLDTVITTAKAKIGIFLPRAFVERLDQIREGLVILKIEGEKMIPEAVKELQSKLSSIQDQMYRGEWNEIPQTMKSSTREIEARLVESVEESKKWVVERMEFPPTKKENFKWRKGWPDLTEGQFVKEHKLPNGKNQTIYEAIEAFSGPIRAVKLPPKTKIWRVLDETNEFSKAEGIWWCYKLPKDGKEWREQYAVLESWSKNGVYVEYVVEKKGLYVWEGKVAGKIQDNPSNTASGQYLHGGGTQILVDFVNHGKNKRFLKKVRMLEKKPTNWGNSHLNINVPEKKVTVQHLKAQEIAPKGNLAFSTTARVSELDTDKKTEVLK